MIIISFNKKFFEFFDFFWQKFFKIKFRPIFSFLEFLRQSLVRRSEILPANLFCIRQWNCSEGMLENLNFHERCQMGSGIFHKSEKNGKRFLYFSLNVRKFPGNVLETPPERSKVPWKSPRMPWNALEISRNLQKYSESTRNVRMCPGMSRNFQGIPVDHEKKRVSRIIQYWIIFLSIRKFKKFLFYFRSKMFGGIRPIFDVQKLFLGDFHQRNIMDPNEIFFFRQI